MDLGLQDQVGRIREAIFQQQLYQCMLSQTLILKSDIETRCGRPLHWMRWFPILKLSTTAVTGDPITSLVHWSGSSMRFGPLVAGASGRTERESPGLGVSIHGGTPKKCIYVSSEH